MAQWVVMNASSGQKEGPFRSRELREQLRQGQVQLVDYIAIQGSPLFRQVFEEDRVFEVYGAEFEDKAEAALSHNGTKNSFLGLASPEAVGRKSSKSSKKQPRPKPQEKEIELRKAELRRARRAALKVPLEVSGLKARQDKKAARRSWRKLFRHLPHTLTAAVVLIGLYWMDQSRLFGPQVGPAVATKTAPKIAPISRVKKKPLRTVPLSSLAKNVGKTILVGPLRYRSQSLRECLKNQKKLAKCEIEVRDQNGSDASLSFFYQAWGKEILKRRESLYLKGLVLADGKTIVLTELISGTR